MKSQVHQDLHSVAVAFMSGLDLKFQRKTKRAELVILEPGDKRKREGLSLGQPLLMFEACGKSCYIFKAHEHKEYILYIIHPLKQS